MGMGFFLSLADPCPTQWPDIRTSNGRDGDRQARRSNAKAAAKKAKPLID
jgi:hypothetical protein